MSDENLLEYLHFELVNFCVNDKKVGESWSEIMSRWFYKFDKTLSLFCLSFDVKLIYKRCLHGLSFRTMFPIQQRYQLSNTSASQPATDWSSDSLEKCLALRTSWTQWNSCARISGRASLRSKWTISEQTTKVFTCSRTTRSAFLGKSQTHRSTSRWLQNMSSSVAESCEDL